MAETRIKREEIKGIGKSRRDERADAADINEKGGSECKECEGNACKWHDDH